MTMIDDQPDRTLPKLRPKDAATLLVIRRDGPSPRVLMGRRVRGHAFMPDKWVFPGGRIHPSDYRIAAATDLAPRNARAALPHLRLGPRPRARRHRHPRDVRGNRPHPRPAGQGRDAAARNGRTSSPPAICRISNRCASSAAPSPRRRAPAASTRASSRWMRSTSSASIPAAARASSMKSPGSIGRLRRHSTCPPSPAPSWAKSRRGKPSHRGRFPIIGLITVGTGFWKSEGLRRAGPEALHPFVGACRGGEASV